MTDIEVLADPDRLAIAADANKRVPGCGRNKQNQRTSIKSVVAGFGGLCVVTAKHLVPRSAERVSAAPPSRGDPRPGVFLRSARKVDEQDCMRIFGRSPLKVF